MLTSDRSKIGSSFKGTYPNINSLYSTIPREMRMHMYRVSEYSFVLAEEAWKAGMFPENLEEEIFIYLKDIFRLHDIGRHYISMELYHKIEELSQEEQEEIKRHTVYAKRAVESLFFPPFPEEYMPYFLDTARYHHERWDGAGYPEGRRGGEIPFLARICAVADAYDGMISWKPYKRSMKGKQAMLILQEESGRQFQPDLIPLFLASQNKIEILDLKNGNAG